MAACTTKDSKFQVPWEAVPMPKEIAGTSAAVAIRRLSAVGAASCAAAFANTAAAIAAMQ